MELDSIVVDIILLPFLAVSTTIIVLPNHSECCLRPRLGAMCVSNTLPTGLYFILAVNNPLKVGTIVITVLQDGRLRLARGGNDPRTPSITPSWAASHSDLSPAGSLPLTSLSACLNDLRCRVEEPYEQPQDLGGALGGVGDTIRNHIQPSRPNQDRV